MFIPEAPVEYRNYVFYCGYINAMKPEQNGLHHAADILNAFSLEKMISFFIQRSLTFGPKCPIVNAAALIQVLGVEQPNGKEPMVIQL